MKRKIKLTDFAGKIRNKNIHIVGVSGSEGSALLDFVLRHRAKKVTGHDYCSREEVEESFRKHNRKSGEEDVSRFRKNLDSIIFCGNKNYLEGIEKADVIFTGQSWRLYRENRKLFSLADKKRFYSLTRIYLEHCPGKVIVLTGTVGKGSTANLIISVLKNAGKEVLFAGNEAWMKQRLDEAEKLKDSSYLVLEISHRQIMDYPLCSPDILAVTNIFQNHLDEVSYPEYIALKGYLAYIQDKADTLIISRKAFDLLDSKKIKSKIHIIDSEKPNKNNKFIQRLQEIIKGNKSSQYTSNILMAGAVLNILGINQAQIETELIKAKSLPGRSQVLLERERIRIINDSRSTTPWATIEALKKWDNVCLIIGGEGKGIDYSKLLEQIEENATPVFAVESQVADNLAKIKNKDLLKVYSDIKSALAEAVRYARKKKCDILISPGGAYFHSKIVKGESLKKLVLEAFTQK